MNPQIKNETCSLILEFSEGLPKDRLDMMLELAEHQEWGIALEALIENISEYSLGTNQIQAETIANLAASMGLKLSIK